MAALKKGQRSRNKRVQKKKITRFASAKDMLKVIEDAGAATKLLMRGAVAAIDNIATQHGDTADRQVDALTGLKLTLELAILDIVIEKRKSLETKT